MRLLWLFSFRTAQKMKFSEKRSLLFTFALQRELDSIYFPIPPTKLFHIVRSRMDIQTYFCVA